MIENLFEACVSCAKMGTGFSVSESLTDGARYPQFQEVADRLMRSEWDEELPEEVVTRALIALSNVSGYSLADLGA